MYLNLPTGLLCRRFPTVYDMLDINDVSGVLYFRRQVTGRRQGDVLYWNLRLLQRWILKVFFSGRVMCDIDIDDFPEILHFCRQVVRHRQGVLWRVAPCNWQMVSNLSKNQFASIHMVDKDSPWRKRQQITPMRCYGVIAEYHGLIWTSTVSWYLMKRTNYLLLDTLFPSFCYAVVSVRSKQPSKPLLKL